MTSLFKRCFSAQRKPDFVWRKKILILSRCAKTNRPPLALMVKYGEIATPKWLEMIGKTTMMQVTEDKTQNYIEIMSFVLLLMYANAPMLLPLSSSLGKTNPCCNSCTKTCHLNSCQRKDQPFLTAWVLSISYIYTCPITTGNSIYIYTHWSFKKMLVKRQ